MLESLGIPVEVFHHEVAGAGQNEIGTTFTTLVERADWTQLQKYVVHNVATPVRQDRHLHAQALSLATTVPACTCTSPSGRTARTCSLATATPACPTTALYYIGGIIKHARALNAITNPGTNSYKRLVPHFEAPVKLAYSAKNRSGFDPHPLRGQPQGPPRGSPLPRSTDEPLPGLRRSADGWSGRRGKQDPSRRSCQRRTCTTCRPEEDKLVPDRVRHSLDQALEHLDKDRAFLTRGWRVHRQHDRRLH